MLFLGGEAPARIRPAAPHHGRSGSAGYGPSAGRCATGGGSSGWGRGAETASTFGAGGRPELERDAFGFLAVVESATHGLFGGYLLVDAGGRPLEFHCTTPVTISRAQAILYGATLDADVRGRQIGAALLAESSLAPRIVLVDDAATATVQDHTDLPVAIVQTRAGAAAECGAPATAEGLCRPDGGGPAATGGWWRIGDARVRLARSAGADGVDPPLPQFDLLEPFERIRAAIDEVQRHG
jgi:hypothetical protein